MKSMFNVTLKSQDGFTRKVQILADTAQQADDEALALKDKLNKVTYNKIVEVTVWRAN